MALKDITQSTMDVEDYSKNPFTSDTYADMRGVVDWGNLLQFAPYESGYCFLAVINGPYIAEQIGDKGGFKPLQNAFIKMLEQEFKGLSGIENISSETMEISDGITTISLLGKVNQSTNSQISMEFTEKSGTLITKYISTYLRFVRDPKTEAKTYGGVIKADNANGVSLAKEVFNFLYIITDATCLNIEKAFLILNAQPTEADYGTLYNFNKGEIGTKEISVNFNAFVVDGSLANKIALVYMRSLVNTADFKKGKINTNSYEMDWSISGLDSNVGNLSDLVLLKKDNKEDDSVKFSFAFDSSYDKASGTDTDGNKYIKPANKDTTLGDDNKWTAYAGLS